MHEPHRSPLQLSPETAAQPVDASRRTPPTYPKLALATMGRSKQSGMSRQLDYRRMAQSEKQRQAAINTPTWLKVVAHCARFSLVVLTFMWLAIGSKEIPNIATNWFVCAVVLGLTQYPVMRAHWKESYARVYDMMGIDPDTGETVSEKKAKKKR